MYTRVVLKFFFCAWRTPGVRPMCAPFAPHLRQAWRRWLSALQLGVLKLAGGVAECILRRRLTTATVVASYDDGSILRRRQRPSATAAYYDDGSVVRRWQATAAARQRRLRLDEGDSGLCRRQTTSHRTRTTASAYIVGRRRQRPTSTRTPSAAASVSSVDRNNN